MNFPIALDRPLIVFDIESTGLFPKKDRIIELAAIKIRPDGSEEERSWLFNPTVPIPPETTRIHGITDEMVKDCFTFAEKATEIFDFFEGCDLSGFNSDRYDIPCLEEEFFRVGLDLGVSNRRRIDVQRIYHRLEPRDLTAAVRFYCRRDHAGAHGALTDARATLDVLKAQTTRREGPYAEVAGRTTAELDAYLNPSDPNFIGRNRELCWRDGQLHINFGKKRGERVRDLMFEKDMKFLRWMLKGDFDTSVKAIIKGAMEGRLPSPPACA